MKTVAAHDRPREKLERLGASSLGDNELVAIVLGQGHANASALDLANLLLSRAGGVAGLARARHHELLQVRGIGAARASQVLAAVELGRRHGVELPVCQQVHRILYEGKAPKAALTELMERAQKTEVWR